MWDQGNFYEDEDKKGEEEVADDGEVHEEVPYIIEDDGFGKDTVDVN